MKRAFYSESIRSFLSKSDEQIVGTLAMCSQFADLQTQKNAWIEQVRILKQKIKKYKGKIYFEFSIPRMGERIDVVLIIKNVVFVLEFKVGEKDHTRAAIDQVWDYALDLKNFHETSHNKLIAPILIPTESKKTYAIIAKTPKDDLLLEPIKCSPEQLATVIDEVLGFKKGDKDIMIGEWEGGSYRPTPTIVEAAMALYKGNSVEDIAKCEADDKNLGKTTKAVAEIIKKAKTQSVKSICFVTGVPGSGKTLVGLDVATKHQDKDSDLYSVFLSGNGPLVKILREALTRDKVKNEKAKGNKVTKKAIESEVKMFIQNVHHFRDDCLVDEKKAPIEHVALFDEAQRAWNLEQTSSFMKRKKNKPNFNQSEPEFLISCLNRHKDWAVVVCLVGGGQEINTGEAGIGAWIDSLNKSFPDWHIHISPNLSDSEYGAGEALNAIKGRKKVFLNENLHLSVSMRSYRAENVSLLVKQILDLNKNDAKKTFESINKKYPIILTRDLNKAKRWLRTQARGSERYGIVVSSQAERLKPYAIDVKSPMDPVHWFLDGKEDTRSSYYLEDVATEFDVQGLELDWSCVTWDADFRYNDGKWLHRSFCGDRWNFIRQEERQIYQKNAYRVLLTRARQGMIIVVPAGDREDPTRLPEFYDSTYHYLKSIGLQEI